MKSEKRNVARKENGAQEGGEQGLRRLWILNVK